MRVLRLSLAGLAAVLLFGFQTGQSKEDRLAQARNLGKAFYENPTTQAEAVGEFKKAFDLAPNSPRERINYGLALLHAGKTEEGIAELEKAQKQDPKIPHTWFNLGIAFKKDSKYDEAIAQLQGMLKLVPEEPVTHYNLGYLYRLTAKPDEAVKEFELSAKYNPDLAGPHFALYNSWRQSRPEDAARENATFLQIRKAHAGAAVAEDLDWSFCSEIYDPAETTPVITAAAPAELKFNTKKLAESRGRERPGLRGCRWRWDGRSDRMVFEQGTGVSIGIEADRYRDQRLERESSAVVPGDYNNDGFADLAIITKTGAELWTNTKGKFAKSSVALPAGNYSNAVWLDYDHDYDLDLFLLGEHSVLMRNNGAAGFSDETKSFPFVNGKAVAGVMFDLVLDTDPMWIWRWLIPDRHSVLYRDRLNGEKWEYAGLAGRSGGGRRRLFARRYG